MGIERPELAKATTDLAPLPEDELLPLLRLLRRAQGFALAFVRSNLPVDSRRIVKELTERLSAGDIDVRELRLTEPERDLHGRLAGLTPPLAQGQAVVVTGLEHSIPSGEEVPPALDRLNRSRELFRDLPCPLVLVLPEYALTQLARQAPDFWAWRSGVFETRSVAPLRDEAALSRELPTESGLENLSNEQKLAHLEVLQETLARHERQGPDNDPDRSYLSYRIAHLLWVLGDVVEAEVYARRALTYAGDDDRARGVALRKIADILGARGELDEALRIRQGEELPLFEKLGDVHERAITLGQIADIFQARGEMDEALRIRQEEELPVYEKLGDHVGKARTLLQVARIDLQREHTESAERRLSESYAILLDVGHLDGMCIVGLDLGQLLCQTGRIEDGKSILKRSRDGFEKLGKAAMVQEIEALLDGIAATSEERPTG